MAEAEAKEPEQEEEWFAIQIPEGVSEEEIAELIAELQKIEGVTASVEEVRAIDLAALVIVAVSAGVVGQSIDAVKNPIKYLRNNAEKLHEMSVDVKEILEIWRGKGNSKAKNKAALEVPQQGGKSKSKSKGKRLKDITEKDLKDAIGEEGAS